MSEHGLHVEVERAIAEHVAAANGDLVALIDLAVRFTTEARDAALALGVSGITVIDEAGAAAAYEIDHALERLNLATERAAQRAVALRRAGAR